jgi:hypothetical protein
MNLLNKLPLGLLATCLFLLAPGSASADVLTLRADVKAGAGGGKGMFGERKADSFHEGHGALSYGVNAGAEVFFVDLWIQHDQFVGGGNVSTWTQFMAGFDVEIDLGEKTGGTKDASGKTVGGYNSMFAELGMGAGFGVGTGQQVVPPLDNSQVTDKGFVFEGRAFVAHRLSKVFAVGLMLPAQFGYFTKSGAGTAANNVDNHYSAVSAAAMLTFRSSWNLK